MSFHERHRRRGREVRRCALPGALLLLALIVSGALVAGDARAKPRTPLGPITVSTEAQFRAAWRNPLRTGIVLAQRHRAARLQDRRSDPRVAPADDPRRRRPHHAPDLLREAAAAAGRHRLSAAQEHHADARRQRRPGRRRDHPRRDHDHGLRASCGISRRSPVAPCSRCAGRRSSARSAPATSPMTTAAASTPGGAACRSTTRSSAATSSTARAARSDRQATS